MTQKTITLNAWSKNEQVKPLVVNQNDILSRTIVINLRDGDNQPLNLTGSTVKVHFVKSDDKIGYISADIIDPLAGQVKCTLTSQITAVDGTVKGTVHIVYTDEQSLHVVGLNIYVNLNDMDSDIESTNDFSALNEGLAKLAGFEQMQADVATNTADISDLEAEKADKSEVIPLSQKGAPGGVALADDVSALQTVVSNIPKILTGRTVAVVTDANVPNSTHVDFPVGFFESRPVVIVNPLTGAPGTVVTGCNAFNPAVDGFDLILTRTTTNNTSVDWVAIGN